jgi:hypothetical protein
MTTWQRKIAEYEADLFKVQRSWLDKLLGGGKSGEIEVKRYEGGEQRMEIDLRGVRCPDGALVTLLVDGKPVHELALRRGFAHLRFSSAEGASIPDVAHGSLAEIRYQGEALLQGTFKAD